MAKSQGSKLAPAEPHELAGLVGYAEGGIVSRTLMETSGGTMTLFAFDAGQALSEHSAPFDAAVMPIEGQLELTIGGKPVRPEAGQIVIMPANVPHAVRSAGRSKMLLVMFRSTK